MSLRPPLVRAILLASGLGSCLAGAWGAAAAPAQTGGTPGGRQATDPLRFIRVYAPADRLQDWPRGDVKYVPMEPKEFERLLSVAQSAGPGLRRSVAGVAAARYHARLADDRLVDGEATLEIFHVAAGGVLLPLAPCGLAVHNPRWAGAEEQAATLGLAEDGKLEVLVEREGRLQLDWSLRGRRDPAGVVRFELALPRCPINHFSLDVPEGLTPVAEHGVVLPAGRPEAGLRRWQIELGGHHRTALRLVPAEVPESYRRLILLRQSLAYDFTLYGVEVSARLQLDVHNEPLERAVLLLDPELQLVTARLGDVEVPWSVEPGSEDEPTRVVLLLPEPIQGTGRVLRLGARAPLKVDQPWQLPAIRLEDASWQEGSATLLVPSPLRLEQLVPVRCRQSKTGPLPTPRSGELAELQYFAADATAQIVLTQTEAPLKLDCAAAIELSEREMTGLVRAKFHVAEGEHFRLEADVARRWLIDSVESVPAAAVEEWSAERTAAEAGRLTIRLARPVTPDRPVELAISGRRLHSPLRRTLRVDDLVLLRFHAAPGGRRLVAVRSRTPSYQIDLDGTEKLTRIDPQSLDRAAVELFAGPPRGMLFEDDAGAESMRLRLETRKPSYSATIQAEATVSGSSLAESYRLVCVPETARVDRVLVQFSLARQGALRWTLGAEDERQLTARRLSAAEEAQAQLPAEGETWEINVRPSRSGRFEIHGSRTTPCTGQEPISLVRLPEASAQQATLVVRSEGPTPVRITNRRLTPIPSETSPPDRYPTARATYQYDPARDGIPRPQAAVTVAPGDARNSPPWAWIWSSQLQSRYEADGSARHIATYRLQNSGRERLALTLPPLAELAGVWIDQTRVPWRQVEGPSDGRLAIDLPPGKRFPVVSLCFSTAGPPLGALTTIETPRPQADVPILGQHWTVWLPPGYEIAAPTLPPQSGGNRPPTWSQRLLGPLGRPRDTAAFDPAAATDWHGAINYHPEQASARRSAEQMLRLVGARPSEQAGARPSETLDWGTLLSSESIGRLGFTILLDRQALAQAGLTPGSPVVPNGDEDPTARGVAVLRQAGLALLVHEDVALLTSAMNAAVYHAYVRELGHESLWWVTPGPLARQMQEAAAKPDSTFVSVDTWRDRPDDARLPWPDDRLAGYQPVDTLGWTACRLEIPGTVPVQLQVVHRSRLEIYRWASFLAVAALAWWALGRHPVVLTGLAGLAGVLALLLPEPYVPVASGAVLATLFCLGCWMISRRPARTGAATDPQGPGQPAAPAGAGPLAGIVAFAVVAMVALRVLGQEPPAAKPPAAKPSVAKPSVAKPPAAKPPVAKPLAAKPPTAPAPVHRVFIPIDEKEQPTGDRYQVPEVLYQELRRREKALAEQARGWLLTGATYRGELSWQTSPNRLVLSTMRAIFDLEVLGSGSQVRIPLGREGANLLPGGVLLDGRAMEPEWEEGGRVLLFSVPEPGRKYRLELALRPTVQTGGAMAELELAIPRLATSRLELTLPRNAPAIEVPCAVGAVTTADGEAPGLIAELGPTDRLVLRWQDGGGPAAGAPAVDVEELLWLKVQPGSVVIDAKFKFKVIEGSLDRVRLVADPRLRLLPFQGRDAPTARSSSASGKPQTIDLQLSQPVADQVVIEAAFLLTGTSGVGNLRLPRLETLDARATRRWLAVSVDPALELPEPAPERPQAVSVPDFLGAWGKTEAQPRFVDSLASGEPSWSMLTRPRSSRTAVNQTLALSFGPKAALVRFDAGLTTTAGYSFQYRLSAPADLEVQSVSVLENGLQRAARWSRAPDGKITVFLTGPVAGRQELSLAGRLPWPGRGRVTLPTLEIEGGELESSVVEVFRQPDVLVRVGKMTGLTEAKSQAVDEDKADLGRLVKRLTGDAKEPIKAVLTLTANRPKVQAQQITSLRCDGEGWEATVDLSISASRGVVDVLRLEVPSSWSGPYKTTPPAVVDLVRNGKADRGQLVVRPHSPIEGDYRIRIAGPLAVASGHPVGVPEIVLSRVGPVERFLVLPTQRQLQPIAWETRGLEKTHLPEGFAGPPVAPESFASYRVVEDGFQARLRPLNEADEVARVHQADVQVAWRADGTCYGVAAFDLTPAGMSQCPLALPPGYRLIQVHVAGAAITPVASGEQQWQVPLGSERLPQRVEVLFAGTLAEPGAAGSRRFDAPRLGDLPVKQTLWTVSGPSPWGPGEPEGGGRISGLRQAIYRLRNVASRIESGSRMLAGQPDETTRWYQAWARRLEAAGAEVRRQLALPPQTDFSRAVRAEIQSIDRRQAQVAEAMGVAEIRARLAAGPRVAEAAEELWPPTLDRSQPASRCVVRGPSDSITLSYHATGVQRFDSRPRAAILLGAVVLLLVAGMRRGLRSAWACRWPHLLGVGAGLAWWLWLWPSILGLVLALLSLAASVRWVWRPSRDSPSAIVPLSPGPR